MTQTDTSVKPLADQPASPAPVRPVLEHMDAKKTPRWLVCLAATANGWAPEQYDDQVTELSEEDYDAAIAAAKSAYDKAGKPDASTDAGKLGAAFNTRAICHETLYLGFVVRRLGPTAAGIVQEKTEKCEQNRDWFKMLAAEMRHAILWPSAQHLDRLRELVPTATDMVLPQLWYKSLGVMGQERAKKR